MGSNTKVPVWLDCDPGHDLTAIGKAEIPVYAGASKGLIRPAVHADAIHGESGLDGTNLLPTPLVPPKTEPSIPAIASALLETLPETAWVVTTGALTNIALLFQAHPTLASHIKGLSIMGGAIGSSFTSAPLGKVDDKARIGNWSAWAEFNILADPEAASFLLSHPILSKKTTLIPLDVTHLVLATAEVQDMLHFGKGHLSHGREAARECSSLRKMLVDLLLFFTKTYADVFGITAGPPLHDPLAVATILDGIPGDEIPFYDSPPHYPTTGPATGPGAGLQRERYAIQVITAGTHDEALAGAQTGRTVATLLPAGEEGVKIPRGLDVKRFWDVLEDCLVLADAVNSEKGIV